jgi:hypothetical protein
MPARASHGGIANDAGAAFGVAAVRRCTVAVMVTSKRPQILWTFSKYCA